MRLSEELYQKYLEELQELDSFKLSHAEGYFGILKEVMEDPHTKHIVETLAFFIARCNLHGEKAILDIYRRLFRQYFPFFWSPLPAMGLVQLSPSTELLEGMDFKAGTEITLRTADKRYVYFQTMEPAKVLPLRYSKSHFDISKNGRTRFFLQFKSLLPLKEEIGSFRLFINSLNYFPSSWSLSIALRQHLQSVKIFYDDAEIQENSGDICPFSFNSISQNSLFSHPLEQLRSLINFPEQELFLDIAIPPHGEKWQSFTLCFDLGYHWPETFPLSEESFQPFVVPVINLQKKAAELIRCNGTKDTYPILYPEPDKHFTVHSFSGIYFLRNHKAIPLKPSFLSGSDKSYEIEPVFTPNQPTDYRLHLDLQESLRTPQSISVEAMWYQPWFDKLDQEIKHISVNQAVNELDTRIVWKLTSPEDRVSSFDIKLLTRLLALKNQTQLELEDILFLLNVLAINEKTYFKEIPKYIRDLKVALRYGSVTSSVSHEYSFMLEKLDEKNQDLVLLYFRNIKKFLDLWLPNIEVEVTINAPNFKEPITIKEGTSHETSALVRNSLLL